MKAIEFLSGHKSLYRYVLMVPFIALVEVISVSVVLPVINFLGDQKTNLDFLNELKLSKTQVFVGFLLITLISFISRLYFENYRIKLSHSFAPKMQRIIVDKFLHGSINNKYRLSQSEFISISTSYIYEYTNKIVTPILSLYYNLVVFIALFLGLIYYTGFEVFLLLLCFAFIYLAIGLIIKKRINQISTSLKVTLDNIYEQLNIIYQNLISIIIEDVRTTTAIKLQKESFRHFTAQAKGKLWSVLPKYILEVMLVLSVISYVFYVPSIDVSELIFLFLIAQKLVPRLQALYNSYVLYNSGQFAIDKISNYIDDFEAFKAPTKVGFSPCAIHVDMENVRQSDYIVFKKLDICIKQRGKYLIRGESGGGKSTLIENLLGLGNNEYLSFSIDSKLDYSQWLKSETFYLNQDYRIQSGTVLNIISRYSDSASEESIDSLLKELRLDITCTSYLEPDGTNLSGGQRQRFLVAIALFSSKNLLVFDEPTSALDKVTEEVVLKCLMRHAVEKTVVIVSHSDLDRKYFTAEINVKDGFAQIRDFNGTIN